MPICHLCAALKYYYFSMRISKSSDNHEYLDEMFSGGSVCLDNHVSIDFRWARHLSRYEDIYTLFEILKNLKFTIKTAHCHVGIFQNVASLFISRACTE